jgi:hypothetical protein
LKGIWFIKERVFWLKDAENLSSFVLGVDIVRQVVKLPEMKLDPDHFEVPLIFQGSYEMPDGKRVRTIFAYIELRMNQPVIETTQPMKFSKIECPEKDLIKETFIETVDGVSGLNLTWFFDPYCKPEGRTCEIILENGLSKEKKYLDNRFQIINGNKQLIMDKVEKGVTNYSVLVRVSENGRTLDTCKLTKAKEN